MNTTTTTTTSRNVGFVKWFNKKSGYGFIKLLQADQPLPSDDDDESSSDDKSDIFVHYTNIRPTTMTSSDAAAAHRYLMKGEYIEFVLTKSENPKYMYFAADVTGLFEGHIMCDMRDYPPQQQQQQQQYHHHQPHYQPQYVVPQQQHNPYHHHQQQQYHHQPPPPSSYYIQPSDSGPPVHFERVVGKRNKKFEKQLC